MESLVPGYKFVGPDFVIIRLDDGTEMKITINCEVFKAKDDQGTGPRYHTNINFNVTVKTPVGRPLSSQGLSSVSNNLPQNQKIPVR